MTAACASGLCNMVLTSTAPGMVVGDTPGRGHEASTGCWRGMQNLGDISCKHHIAVCQQMWAGACRDGTEQVALQGGALRHRCPLRSHAALPAHPPERAL